MGKNIHTNSVPYINILYSPIHLDLVAAIITFSSKVHFPRNETLSSCKEMCVVVDGGGLKGPNKELV